MNGKALLQKAAKRPHHAPIAGGMHHAIENIKEACRALGIDENGSGGSFGRRVNEDLDAT
jgi:hypothetical protein